MNLNVLSGHKRSTDIISETQKNIISGETVPVLVSATCVLLFSILIGRLEFFSRISSAFPWRDEGWRVVLIFSPFVQEERGVL